MRPGAILVLLGLVVLFAFFGWQVLGWIALSVLLFVVLAVGILVLALWRLKVRMKRKMQEVARELEARLRAAGATVPPDQQGPPKDYIDVEGTVRKPRDGADDPDLLGQAPDRPDHPDRPRR